MPVISAISNQPAPNCISGRESRASHTGTVLGRTTVTSFQAGPGQAGRRPGPRALACHGRPCTRARASSAPDPRREARPTRPGLAPPPPHASGWAEGALEEAEDALLHEDAVAQAAGAVALVREEEQLVVLLRPGETERRRIHYSIYIYIYIYIAAH